MEGSRGAELSGWRLFKEVPRDQRPIKAHQIAPKRKEILRTSCEVEGGVADAFYVWQIGHSSCTSAFVVQLLQSLPKVEAVLREVAFA